MKKKKVHDGDGDNDDDDHDHTRSPVLDRGQCWHAESAQISEGGMITKYPKKRRRNDHQNGKDYDDDKHSVAV